MAILVFQDKKAFAFFTFCVLALMAWVSEIMSPGLILSSRKEVQREPCPSMANCPDKQGIARTLTEVHGVLKMALLYKKPPTSHVLIKLEGIIEQLDAAFSLSHTKERAKETVRDSDVVVDVCPEEYHGEHYGYPFFHTGWIITNCTQAKPLAEVITVLLNTVEYPAKDEKQVGVVLEGITTVYPGVKIYVAPKNDKIQKLASQYKHVTIVKPSKRGSTSLASVWNQLVSAVNTPYALVARDVVHFDFNARLERQIRMISDTDYVGVVGGAFRNLTGHWRIGCRQTRMMNYALRFQEGYHYSRKSCMFCDDLEGPFVARTAILKSNKFNAKFSREVIFEDFFIRVIGSGPLVMNCPDVMYYTADYSSEKKKTNKQVWQGFAKEWILVRVVLPGNIRHAFSCKEISYKCNVKVTKYAPLPACCVTQYADAVQFMQQFCVTHNVPFELDAGSNLAAVKFSNYNPFDLDGDFSMLSNNYSFMKQNAPYFRKHGYPITAFESPTFDDKGNLDKKGYFLYWSPEIYTEVNGFGSMSAETYLPPEFRDIKHYTKVQFDGRWVNSMFNPGLFARNRYGMDVLKHSQSWLQVGGMGSSWERYESGTFLRCKRPGFHSCLDRFPVDGNLAFRVDD